MATHSHVPEKEQCWLFGQQGWRQGGWVEGGGQADATLRLTQVGTNQPCLCMNDPARDTVYL